MGSRGAGGTKGGGGAIFVGDGHDGGRGISLL